MSQTVTPPVADDIAFVLGLPADRQSAVLSALVKHLTGGRADPVIPITAEDGRPVGNFQPHSPELLAVVAGFPPARLLAPLPPDFDPDDYLSDEEIEELRAETHA